MSNQPDVTEIPNSPHYVPIEIGDTGQKTAAEWFKFCAEEARKQSSKKKE